MGKTNLLHDRIDQTEDLRDRARELTEKIIKDKMGEALNLASHDMSKMLEILAGFVGDALADLTTEAVQHGYNYAVKRAKYGKSG